LNEQKVHPNVRSFPFCRKKIFLSFSAFHLKKKEIPKMLMISDRGKRRRADLIKSPKYGGPLVNAFFAIFVYPRENM
jgi:hypothetical protein